MKHSIFHPPRHIFARSVTLLALSMIFAAAALAQAENQTPFGSNRNNENDQPKSIKEFLAKQRADKSRKDHEELLKRGDELVLLVGQLEAAYERNKGLTASDREKLESVEKLAERIRRSLGGDDDGADELAERAAEAKLPETTKEAVVDLREMVIKLGEELKKTSRFSISVVAIQTSNSVLKLVRFLRLRK